MTEILLLRSFFFWLSWLIFFVLWLFELVTSEKTIGIFVHFGKLLRTFFSIFGLL